MNYNFGLILYPFFILSFWGICFLIFRKFRYDLKPIHVFILNFVGSFSLIFFIWEISIIMLTFGFTENFCLEYIFALFASLTCSFGVISMQIDRFLAIYWHMHYEERITTSKATKSCIFSASLAALFSAGVFVFDQEYTTCIRPSFLIFTRGTNLFFDGVPRIIAVSATMMVSMYVLNTHRRLSKNKVHPTQALNQPNTLNARNIHRMNDDPNLFYPPENIDTGSSTEDGQLNVMVNEEPTTQCLDNQAFLQMLMLTLRINLSTLVSLVLVVPFIIFGMANINCDVKKNECDSFIRMYLVLQIFRGIFLSIQILFIFKRLLMSEL